MTFEKLIKIMMLTTSSVDGEALAAIRKANTMLAESNLNWKDLIDGVIAVQNENERLKKELETASKPTPPPWEQMKTHPFQPMWTTVRAMWTPVRDYKYACPEIDAMFNYMLHYIPKGSYRDFIESIYSNYKDYGRLTIAQYERLREGVERQKRRYG